MTKILAVALLLAPVAAIWKRSIRTTSGLAEAERCRSYDDPLLMLTAGGLVLTGAGLPMLIVGAKKIPVYRARVSPWLTPRSGGLTLQLSL